MQYWAIFSLLATVPVAQAIAFEGPAPTDISPHRVFDGFSPAPTTGPSVNELKKRQGKVSPEVCGWVDGDFSSAVSCSVGRSCMLYKSAGSGMAGCCSGRDTQDCGWAHSCINLSKYAAGNCGTSCMLDSFVRKCTNVAMPYCVTWTYPADGIADYGCDSTSDNAVSTVRQSARDIVGGTTSIRLPTLAAGAVTIPTGGSTISHKTVKKIAIGTIIGIVIAALFLLFFVIIGVVIFLKRRKKQQQIAANARIVANAQANRPQSQYQPPPPPPMQHGPPPPMPPQSPQPTINGYFSPQTQHEQKFGAHTSVHEYAMSPISNPPTPAPAYSQPYAPPAVPPMPQQQTAQYQAPVNGTHDLSMIGVSRPPPQNQGVSPIQQYSSPTIGAHEVDAASVPQAPGRQGPVYEMGQGK